ncbi:hypothetical protein [Streptomyces morookaense]|uniref:Aminoglycoside phosphotransferase domain-containing protein n=1 Tax=Streptomyces morookaense TaxID=1970 RepID=A0A7Y7B494_STRMO|nr:hypothetical protein [Streptomyces morookaense]NVK78564.1 hypothetical protein [Streptomyces morookaense]GHF33356.1 hypothetical protein GCM10010359_40100 [Streptomyces morookaense]
MYAPPDELTRARMEAAFAEAARRFAITPDGPPAWGWQGCTLGRRAGDRWLRVASGRGTRLPERRQGEGMAGAEELLPADVPRPHLYGTEGWVADDYVYEAELADCVTTPVVSPHRCDIAEDPGLPEQWWADLRRALDVLAKAPAGRTTVRDSWATAAFPHFLGIPAPETIERTTGHGDLQWANLTGHPLVILDWERWGRVPVGFDAGTLHAASLGVPTIATKVRDVFSDALGTDAGRVGELCALAEMLQAVARGFYPHLADALADRVEELTGTRPPRTPVPELPSAS